MKKFFLLFLIALLAAATISASTFSGTTSIGGSYTFRDGEHLGGISSQTFGFTDCPVGYFIGLNSAHNRDGWGLNMIIGPAYKYYFTNVPMSIDAAIGASLSGEWTGESVFDLGIGGYLGSSYYINELVSIMLGLSLGYDMLAVDLTNGSTSFANDFHVSPSLSIGFSY